MVKSRHDEPMEVKEVMLTKGSPTTSTHSKEFGELPNEAQIDPPRGGLLSGWKGGLLYCASLVFLVCLTNIGFTIWIAVNKGWDLAQAGVLLEGDCDDIKRSNTILHLFTNLLSTVLLGCSSYTMQFLSAPTRKAVDKAHAQGRFLRIGVPSLGNLRMNGKKKMFLWALLAVSSLPLHLFFNSVFYVIVSANNYSVFSVADYFLEPNSQANLDTPGFKPFDPSLSQGGPNAQKQLQALPVLQQAFHAGQLETLSKADCISAYAQDYVTDRTHLLLVATHNSSSTLDAQHGAPGLVYNSQTMNNANLFGRGCHIDPYPWICPPAPGDEECPLPCKYRLDSVFDNINDWEALGVQVDHCLSMPVPSHCQLQFSRPITSVVIASNIVKIAIICTVAFGNIRAPLATTGDAIASFLTMPDRTTSRRCLATQEDFTKAPGGGFHPTPARQWSNARPRWFRAASKKRWIFFTLFLFVSLLMCVILLIYGINHIVGLHTHTALFALGLGAIHFETLISSITPSQGVSGLVSNVLVANSPQLILSMFYFAINGVLTCMVAAREWSEFAYARKGLRVSDKPRGVQRVTYFLSLPYRYVLPLMAISTILHWLVSQSLFLVVLRTYCDDLTWCPLGTAYGSSAGGEAFGMCWSPLGVVLTIIIGVLMAGYVLGLGFQRYKPGLPLAAGNSAVISAACHPLETQGLVATAASAPLRWGVVGRLADLKSEEVWHVAFVGEECEIPVRGQLCA